MVAQDARQLGSRRQDRGIVTVVQVVNFAHVGLPVHDILAYFEQGRVVGDEPGSGEKTLPSPIALGQVDEVVFVLLSELALDALRGEVVKRTGYDIAASRVVKARRNEMVVLPVVDDNGPLHHLLDVSLFSVEIGEVVFFIIMGTA